RRLSAALSDRPHRTPAPSSIGSRVHPNRALRAPSAFASRISRSYRRANCGQRIHSRAPRSLLIVPGIFLFLRAWRLSRPRASSCAFGPAAAALAAQPPPAKDPGVRSGTPGAGGTIRNLTSDEQQLFVFLTSEFTQTHSVAGAVGDETG